MRIKGRRFTVVGAGKSGVAAANLLASRGGDVLLTEVNPGKARPEALLPGAAYRAGSNDVRPGDIAVLSPGIPEVSPARATIAAQASEVMGEVELFYRVTPAPIIAITGTDGKSTVTTMLGAICEAAGLKTHVGGNLGNPLCEMADDISSSDVVIAEVSCFQLTTCDSFRPRVAVVTNIAEDHVDYHGSFAKYQAAKRRVAAYMRAEDTLVLNRDDAIIQGWSWSPRPQISCFSLERHDVEGFLREDALWLREGDETNPLMPREALPLLGRHNVANALAAALGAQAYGISREAIREALSRYEALPHRLRPVRELSGVQWINDSKATNPNATAAALQAMVRPTILLAGGSVKDADFTALGALIRSHTLTAILFGETQAALADAIGTDHPVIRVEDLQAAVTEAKERARTGSAVLLSPACASYDQFRSYAHRGEVFEDLVHRLA